jgi:hypothetical protein
MFSIRFRSEPKNSIHKQKKTKLHSVKPKSRKTRVATCKQHSDNNIQVKKVESSIILSIENNKIVVRSDLNDVSGVAVGRQKN